MPHISVLLPVYNAGPYLDGAIRSIREQTYGDFEFVIVNDGSTDGSIETIERHAAEDGRIVVLDRPNGGIVDALNAGLAVCCGEFIARMDGDDLSHRDRLRRQLEFLQDQRDVVAVGSAVQRVCGAGIPLGVEQPPLHHDPIVQQLFRFYGRALIHPSVMFRTQVLQQIGGYRCAYCLVEDLDLYLRLARKGRLSNLGEVLLDYRVHETSTNFLHGAEQARLAFQCVSEAYAERGEPMPEGLTVEWGRPDPVVHLHECARAALKQGRPAVALRYALRSLAKKPLSRTGLQAACAAIIDSAGLGPQRSRSAHGPGSEEVGNGPNVVVQEKLAVSAGPGGGDDAS